ncbi:MAG: hypothetical protein SchgKO_06220 [Schleiferiaceae bacterium]
MKISAYALGILILSLFLFWQYAISDWNSNVSQENLQEYISHIQESEALPPEIIEVFYERYPVESSGFHLLNQFMGNRSRSECPCLWAARTLDWAYSENSNDNRTNLLLNNSWITAQKIEKEVSQDQCLQFVLANMDFIYNTEGIQEAAKFYFQKPLDSLSEREIRSLVIMTRNPVLYNPKRNPESLNHQLENWDDHKN